MDGLALLDTAHAAGLTVRAEGLRLVIRGPKRAEPIARELLAHKPAVLAALTRSAWCRHRRLWLSIYDRLVCAICHPPAAPELVKEWLSADPSPRRPDDGGPVPRHDDVIGGPMTTAPRLPDWMAGLKPPAPPTPADPFLTGPRAGAALYLALYTYRELAALWAVTEDTAQRWVKNYERAGHEVARTERWEGWGRRRIVIRGDSALAALAWQMTRAGRRKRP